MSTRGLSALLLALLICGCGEDRTGSGTGPTSGETDKRIPRELLLAIPYVEGTRDTSSLSGVLEHDENRAWNGVNLFQSTNASRAWLLDMDGKGVWSWSSDRPGWDLSQLNEDGSLYAMFINEGISRIDKDSNVIWSIDGLFHHALELDDEGRIYTIETHPEVHPDINTHPIPVDYAVILEQDGTEIERFSLLDVLVESGLSDLLPTYESLTEEDTEKAELDFLHTNHIEPIPSGFEHLGSPFTAGNLIISFRNIHLVAIVDRETRRVVWSWGPGELYLQHHPVLLENGHLLIFNNGREASAVVELDPLTSTIVWSYEAEDLWSRSRGSVQRLPNGNTLITESNTGYVFEVTPSGERVWTFANPETMEATEGDLLRRAIYRMTRYPVDYAAGWTR